MSQQQGEGVGDSQVQVRGGASGSPQGPSQFLFVWGERRGQSGGLEGEGQREHAPPGERSGSDA